MEKKKCNCLDSCTCGCKEGKKCTCGCQEGKKCNCGCNDKKCKC